MAWLYFFLLVLFWGCSFIAIRFSLEGFAPFAAAATRIGIAAVAMIVTIVIVKVPVPKARRAWVHSALLGILNFTIPWATLFWGEQYVAPALASVLNATVPLFVFLISWIFIRGEAPTRTKLVGIGLGFLGIVSIFSPSLRGIEMGPGAVMGCIAILVMSISYAWGAVLTKKVSTYVDSRWMIAIGGATSSLTLAVLSAGTETTNWGALWTQHQKAVISIIYLGLISTALAWYLWVHLIQMWGAIRASAVTYLAPMIAIFVDWVALRRLPTSYEWLGAFLIIFGLVVLNRARLAERVKSALPQKRAAS